MLSLLMPTVLLLWLRGKEMLILLFFSQWDEQAVNDL